MEHNYNLLFCNDLANRISSKVLNTKKKDKKFDSKLLNYKILFEYKNFDESKTNPDRQLVPKTCFNLKDVARMPQDQISKMVFSFNKATTESNIFDK